MFTLSTNQSANKNPAGKAGKTATNAKLALAGLGMSTTLPTLAGSYAPAPHRPRLRLLKEFIVPAGGMGFLNRIFWLTPRR